MNRRNQLLQESNKIVVKNLYKIFGDDNAEGMDLLRSGLDKEEILKQTSMVVGVSDVNFSIKQGEIFVFSTAFDPTHRAHTRADPV